MPTGSEPAVGPRVALRNGRLVFNGRELTPFGGELQYFRVRDPQGDGGRTHELWRETLERMAKAGMNFLSTYVPWDWHAPDSTRHDWGGDRDLGAFLEMAHALKFVVCLKPGPYITAEWPEGFRTFGAVPAWFKERHPETLVRRPGGALWSFDPLGRRDQVQPRYDAPAFIDAVRQWFAALAPVIRPFLHARPCVAMIQLDNETNLWWSDLAHVDLPGDYAGRLRHCVNYLAVLRDIWRDLDIDEPDVLFTANDSPFAIPLRHNLLQDAGLKSAVALPTLDVYPRGIPLRDIPADQPWQGAFFTRLLERHAPERFAFGAEIQGMDLKLAFGATATARPEATGQLLTSMIGSGLKGGALYVMREGLNADGTLYGPAACFAIHGDATARWDVASRFARWMREDG
ncbi:MAG: beta-galactosidase, partial [Candidatus Brocadiae bacterium]|nr:beta-galactosidase [Candidatus Brocadiia bacterium]